MQSEKPLYRFSPIESEDTLRQTIAYIVERSSALIQVFSPGTMPIESVTVCAHYHDEYEYLAKLVGQWGKSAENGYIELAEPFITNQISIPSLRIRQPDPYRSQVGSADFAIDFSNAAKLIAQHPKNIRLIQRPHFDLVEFHHPDYDVLAYVLGVHESEDQQAALPKEVNLYADGGSRGNPGPSASGYVLMDKAGQVFFEAGVYLGITTNNQAEYQALKFGLEQAKKMGIHTVYVHMDSLLVVNQMKGIFKVKNRDLWPIHEAIQLLLKDFKKVTFTHVPREFNKLADAEVNKCLDAQNT